MEKREVKYRIEWSVHPLRRDKRTGPINPDPRSPYLKRLFKEEEARFKKQ